MADLYDPAYVADLVNQLRVLRAEELRRSEDENQEYRALKAAAARFVQDPAYDYTARTQVAELFAIPAPKETPDRD